MTLSAHHQQAAEMPQNPQTATYPGLEKIIGFMSSQITPEKSLVVIGVYLEDQTYAFAKVDIIQRIKRSLVDMANKYGIDIEISKYSLKSQIPNMPRKTADIDIHMAPSHVAALARLLGRSEAPSAHLETPTPASDGPAMRVS